MIVLDIFDWVSSCFDGFEILVYRNMIVDRNYLYKPRDTVLSC